MTAFQADAFQNNAFQVTAATSAAQQGAWYVVAKASGLVR